MSSSELGVQTVAEDVRLRIAEQQERFRVALSAGQQPHVREYLNGWSGQERMVLLHDLLFLEVQHRSQSGETLVREEYRSRFPDANVVVDEVFAAIESGHFGTEFRGRTTLTPGIGNTKLEEAASLGKPDASRPDASGQNVTGVEQLGPVKERPSDGLETLDEKTTVVASQTSRRPSPGRPGGTLGDYELLDELGKGGMGVVYRARQRAANRIVALKVIRPDRLSGMSGVSKAKAIERFRAEAIAAARLQHDNLVTVYEVGEADGCHFFSMQFVEGSSLADKLRTGPIDNRQAAAVLEPVCRAIQAAHERGILHRDIKPHNILIESATNRPRIADFGLAKLLDQDIEITKAGEAMGTPPYMPPEQFTDAARVTACSDVYALGATLYHVLSGRPPFQAASSIATMRQVLDKDPVPLRQLNAAVDADLETICMKCLEKEPTRRYGSAAELADELKRYLDGRPILSRPISRVERLSRWCRRNPLIATLSGVVALSVLIAVTSLAVGYVQTGRAKMVVEKSLGETKVAQALSEASFQDALSAVNEFFTRVSEDRLLNEPGAQGLRRELLQLAHEYYLRLLIKRAGDPTVKEELAATHYRIGLIVEELDSPKAAMMSYETARRMLITQLKEKPDSKSLQQFLSNTLNAMGRAATRNDELDQAEKFFVEARQLRLWLVQKTNDPMERFEYERLLANVDMNLGLLDRRRDEFDAARQRFEDAQQDRLKTLTRQPKDRKLRRDLAKGYYNLANLAVDKNDSAAVKENIREAIKLYDELLHEKPDDLEDQHQLALCHLLWADLQAALMSTDPAALGAAIDAYSQARRAFEHMAARNPAIPRYRSELAQLILNLGQLEAQRQRYEESQRLLEEAARLLEELVKEVPDSSEYSELREKAQDSLRQLEAIRKGSS